MIGTLNTAFFGEMVTKTFVSLKIFTQKILDKQPNNSEGKKWFVAYSEVHHQLHQL